jgi:hypothetical protein
MASAVSLGRPFRPKVPNGGTTAPGKIPSATPGAASPASTSPPAFTFDPSLAAKQREAGLKEEQNLEDIKTQQHFDTSDFHTALGKLATTGKRERQKFGFEEKRGGEKIGREEQGDTEKLGNEESDTRKNAGRQFEDFATRRKEIGRQFGELAQRQSESQNASGTLDQGTSAAAAAARARNQQISEAPIATSEQRLGEDLTTALERIGTARGKVGTESDRERTELAENLGIGRSQLAQDLGRERGEAKRNLGRQDFELGRSEQRTKLAGVNAKQNYLEEEIYQAMEEHPGEFKKWAEENPSLLPAGVTPSGAGAPSAPVGGLGGGGGDGPRGNGGTAANVKRKKGGR